MTPHDHAASVDAMVADAAALVNVVAQGDLPHGFVIVTARLHGPYLGIAPGTGYALAEAHGARYGQAAVWVDPEKFCRAGVTPEAVSRFTSVVLHEVAHTLVAPAEATSPEHAERLVRDVQEAPCADALRSARSHAPRWAAAYVVLTDRALPFRPRIRHRLEADVCRDLAGYGHDLAELRRVIGTALQGELRPRLAAGTVWAQVLERALPPEAERVAAVARTLADAGIGVTGAGG